jgi:hypothetical protein
VICEVLLVPGSQCLMRPILISCFSQAARGAPVAVGILPHPMFSLRMYFADVARAQAMHRCSFLGPREYNIAPI